MRIRYTQYKNSVLATMIDVIGSGFCALGVLIVVMAFVETMQGNQGIQIDNIIGLIISCATIFPARYWFEKVGQGNGCQEGKKGVGREVKICRILQKDCRLCTV